MHDNKLWNFLNELDIIWNLFVSIFYPFVIVANCYSPFRGVVPTRIERWYKLKGGVKTRIVFSTWWIWYLKSLPVSWWRVELRQEHHNGLLSRYQWSQGIQNHERMSKFVDSINCTQYRKRFLYRKQYTNCINAVLPYLFIQNPRSL